MDRFADEIVQEVAEVLGDTDDGLIGREIGAQLAACDIADPGEMTKRDRLYEALTDAQKEEDSGAPVVRFIERAMAPVAYKDKPDVWNTRRDKLNRVLVFAGHALAEDGRVGPSVPARTLEEAQARADRLRARLQEHHVHPDVLEACRAELVAEDYFHAVLEACKSLAEKVRTRAGVKDVDGAGLVDAVFEKGQRGHPLLVFNDLSDRNDRNEHDGLKTLMRGVFKAFRNPCAHVPRVMWHIEEQDALDILSLISLLHRRVEAAQGGSPRDHGHSAD